MPLSPELLDRIARDEYTDERLELRSEIVDQSLAANLEHETMTEADLDKLITALNLNTHIKEFHPGDYNISDMLMMELIRRNKTLRILCVEGNSEDVLVALVVNETLEELYMSIAYVTRVGIDYIMINGRLTKIDLSQCNIDDADVVVLAQHPILKELYVSDYNFTNTVIEAFRQKDIKLVGGMNKALTFGFDVVREAAVHGEIPVPERAQALPVARILPE